jgi:hypothetical protein
MWGYIGHRSSDLLLWTVKALALNLEELDSNPGWGWKFLIKNFRSRIGMDVKESESKWCKSKFNISVSDIPNYFFFSYSSEIPKVLGLVRVALFSSQLEPRSNVAMCWENNNYHNKMCFMFHETSWRLWSLESVKII